MNNDKKELSSIAINKNGQLCEIVKFSNSEFHQLFNFLTEDDNIKNIIFGYSYEFVNKKYGY